MQISHLISGITELKLKKYLPDVKESSAVLTQQSELRHFHSLLKASARNEDKVCQYSPKRATNQLP